MQFVSLEYRVVLGPLLEHAPVGACSVTLDVFQTDETQTARGLANLVAQGLETVAVDYKRVTLLRAVVEEDFVAPICFFQDDSEGFTDPHFKFLMKE